MQTRAPPRCIGNAECGQGLSGAAMAPREIPIFLITGSPDARGLHGWSAADPEVAEIWSSSSALPMHEPLTDWSPLAAPGSKAWPVPPALCSPMPATRV